MLVYLCGVWWKVGMVSHGRLMYLVSGGTLVWFLVEGWCFCDVW